VGHGYRRAAGLRQDKQEKRREDEKEKIRVTLDLTPAMKAVLDRLAEQAGITPSRSPSFVCRLLNAIKKAEVKDNVDRRCR